MSATTPAAGATSSGRQQPLLRPLPRRRSAALLLRPVDLFWLAVLAAISCALALYLRIPAPVPPATLPMHHSLTVAIGAGSMALANIGVYLTGLRLKDRPTAIIGSLLLATSLAFATGATWAPQAMLMAALATSAIFCYAMGWTVASLCLAGIATFVRADGLLLGIVLAIVALCQCRANDWAAALAFLLLAAIAGALWIAPWHAQIGIWLPLGALQPANLLMPALTLAPVAWFLFAYLTELGTAKDRAKWWPAALWIVLYLALLVGVHAWATPAGYLPFLPVLYLMIGAGIARLLPAFAGELPMPLARYVVATAAVGVLLAAAIALPWLALREPAAALAYGTPISARAG